MRAPAADGPGGPAASGQAGFSLVETLLAVLILAVGVTVVLRSFGSSLEGLGTSADYTRGLALVEARLWELEASGSIVPGTSSGPFTQEEDRRFRWQVQASDLGDTGLCETRVTVSWAQRGRPRDVSVVTYLTRER
jgi:prepilin-type N-terminal cleavage/methylation domain-containing protein